MLLGYLVELLSELKLSGLLLLNKLEKLILTLSISLLGVNSGLYDFSLHISDLLLLVLQCVLEVLTSFVSLLADTFELLYIVRLFRECLLHVVNLALQLHALLIFLIQLAIETFL